MIQLNFFCSNFYFCTIGVMEYLTKQNTCTITFFKCSFYYLQVKRSSSLHSLVITLLKLHTCLHFHIKKKLLFHLESKLNSLKLQKKLKVLFPVEFIVFHVGYRNATPRNHFSLNFENLLSTLCVSHSINFFL